MMNNCGEIIAIVLRFVDRSWSQSIIGNVEEWGGVLRRFQPFLAVEFKTIHKVPIIRGTKSLPENFKFQEKKSPFTFFLASLLSFLSSLFFIIVIRLLLLVIILLLLFHVNDDD